MASQASILVEGSGVLLKKEMKMAIMKMSEDKCVSGGERFAYHFFKKHLTDDYKIYSNVLLFHKTYDGGADEVEIDFIIFHKHLGLLAIEVKDWRIDQIQDVRQDSIDLNYNRIKSNPIKGARFKAQVLKNKLEDCPEFTDYCHRLMLPVHGCCSLPYIRWNEWQEKLRSLMILNPENTGICQYTSLFKEDFVDDEFQLNKADSLRRLKSLRRNPVFEFSWSEGHEHMLDEVLGAEYVVC